MNKWLCRLGACVVFSSGCNLVNELENLKDISFTMPAQSYSVSTDDPSWHAPPAAGIPAVTCGPTGVIMDCCAPPAPLPAVDCTRTPLVCDAGMCALKFSYEQVQTVDLGKDVPALASNKGTIFSDILLKTIDLDITNNTMNVTLPPVDIYLAPANVTSTSDPSAHRIATMSMETPGFTGPESIPLDDAAQAVFSSFARDFETPFNVIIATVVEVKSGDVPPMGRLDFSVSGQVEAKF